MRLSLLSLYFSLFTVSSRILLSMHCKLSVGRLDAPISKEPAKQRRRRLFPDRPCPEVTCPCFVVLNK